MKLFGDKRSGNCDKVRFVADHLNINYQWIEVDSLHGETRTVDFLKKNPMGQIPYLELFDGSGLAQSNAIVRFLAKGSALMPNDDFLRAKVDEWMFWEANNHEFFIAGCIGHMTYMGESKKTRDPLRVNRGEQALDIMGTHLKKRNWFVGQEITVADVALLAYTRKAHLGGFDMTNRQQIRSWIKRAEKVLGISALPC